MLQFLNQLFQMLGSAFHAAFWFVSALSVLMFLANLMGANKRHKHGRRHGLFHVHETTAYERKRAINARINCETKGENCDEDTEGLPVNGPKPIAVIKVDNDMQANFRKAFARLVDEVLANKEKLGGIVVVANSPGGSVAEYGQMYAEMERLRKSGLYVTACADTYAASGGMLQILPANKIIAAPFCIVGSIGVVSEFVNVHDFLTRMGIRPMTMTAGKWKRTLTPMGEITPEGEEHFKNQLEAVHRQFKEAVAKYRPQVDLDNTCTGDHWSAQESVRLQLGLVDDLATSEEVLFVLNQGNDLILLSERQNPFERGLFRFVSSLIDRYIGRLRSRVFGGGVY